MKKIGVLFILVMFLLFASLVSATIINVPGDYATIQEAIDNSTAGDTINVAAGTYVENLVIDKNIELIGQAGATITASSGAAAVSIIDTSNVKVEGFDITTNNVVIGIWIAGSSNGENPSSNLEIKNNNILINGVSTGIYAAHSNPAHSDWLIQGNTIDSAGVNLELYDVKDVEVKENTFEGNGNTVSVVYASELSNVNNADFTDNIFNGNGNIAGVTPTFWIESDFINGDGDTSVNDILIQDNEFSNWVNYGIRIGEGNPNFDDVSNIIINNNTFNHDVDQEIIEDNPSSATGTGNIFNVKSPAKIQQAIDSAFDGDTINVDDGTYNEQLVINKDGLILHGDGASNTIIDLGQPSETTGIWITANNIIFEGFTVRNISTTSSHAQYAIRVRGLNNKISNNIIIGQASRDWYTDEEDSGINIDGTSTIISTGNIVENNEIYDFSAMGVQVVNSGNYNTHDNIIRNNYIHNIQFYSIAIDRSGNNIIKNNTLKNIGPSGYSDYPSAGIVVWGTQSSGTQIINQEVRGIERGIALSSAQGIIIKDSIIADNTLTGVYINSGSGVGNQIIRNNITGNTIGLNSTSPNNINAEYNWWGSCDGPSGIGPGSGDAVFGNVDYTPWFGICIENKTDVTCKYKTDNITLEADLTGIEIEDVWFSININGTNQNKTGTNVGGNKYSYTIPSADLVGGQNVTWNVYASDSTGRIYNNSWKTFYVRERTQLIINPQDPDGLNSWYIFNPVLNLIKDSLGGNIYYRWDSTGDILYTGPFGFDAAPNNQNITGGIIELNWWTDFGICGDESEQSHLFKIDLTNPQIVDLQPADQSTVTNNLRPKISAYLDEVYQSNSGIDKSSVIMKLDGTPVSATVKDADTLDATVSYTPNDDLSTGMHNVSVYAEDNAGRNSELTWFFDIEITPAFTMIVYSPEEKTYASKKVPFNISLSDDVKLIEYINYADTKPKWIKLCTNCDEYGFSKEKTKTLKEGENNITIRASDSFGQVKEGNIVLFVDSKAPRISSVMPRRNAVTNGSDFYIKYTEENLKKIELFWNPSQELTGCSSGKNQECTTSANLSAFEDQYIDYYFEVSDSVNTVQSRTTRVKVDTISPKLIVNAPEDKTGNETYGRTVPFNITVTEDVLLEYIDNSATNPRWRNICSNCNEYGDSRGRTKSFSKGIHNIQIRATDDAGNFDIEDVSFNVDY